MSDNEKDLLSKVEELNESMEEISASVRSIDMSLKEMAYIMRTWLLANTPIEVPRERDDTDFWK